MTKHARTSVVGLSLALCCVTSSVLAAKPEADEAERSRVQQALQSETATEPNAVNRRSLLQPTQRPETKSDLTWWQSGYVKVDGQWCSAEKSAASIADTAVLTEYRRQRKAAPKTVAGQLALANWCRSQNLKEEERAHLISVLALSGAAEGSPGIYQRLGCRKIGGRWIWPEDLESYRRESLEMSGDLKLWQARLERLAERLNGDRGSRRQAEEELANIRDPSAVPGLVRLAFTGEPTGLAVVEVLQQMDAYQASQALASLAVNSPSRSVQNSAAEALKGRRQEDFVPLLLTAMRGAIRVKETPTNQEDATNWILIREDSDRIRVLDLRLWQKIEMNSMTFFWSVKNPKSVPPPMFHRSSSPVAASSKYNPVVVRQRIDFVRDLELAIEQSNNASDAANQRIGDILSSVSGQAPSADPNFWNSWWAFQTGYEEVPKQIVVEQEDQQRVVQGFQIQGMQMMSCLVAGTPLWTKRGLEAVEQIQTGDCVLAKNIETGELAYKPVLHTTVRRPVSVKRFVVNGQPIVASEGHNFWVSGGGWIKMRELIPQQPLHTVTGMARIESIEDEAEPAPVYNLVVADFHTYFVGPAMILSHDVLPPQPTNVKVPGLAAK